MYWTDAWKFGAAMWQAGVDLHETAMASGAVIGHRTGDIGGAMRDPLGADMAELDRMVPEKLAAFGKAGASLVNDWMGMRAEMMAQGRDLAALALAGRPPTLAAMDRLGRRASGLAVRMGGAGGRALGPIHRTATANRRRLAKRK